MTKASDLKNRFKNLMDDGGGQEQYENDGDATHLKQFDLKDQKPKNVHFSHIRSKEGKKEILDYNFNPFVFDCKLSTCDKLVTAIFTVFILPCRVLLITILLIISWILSTIGLWGLSFDDICAKPLSDWRRKVQRVTATMMRAVFYVGSFTVKINGTRASSKEAPIMVVAPHSSLFDPIAIVFLGPPSVVAKAETASTPLFGKLINFTQPIFVSREDPDSRQKTIKNIIERANSDKEWPQTIIFPEGTCTNRTCLITFKPGAFYPTVPVQPVCLRFPDKLDTVTWTWEGPGTYKLLWLTLCRPRTQVLIDLLPVYTPSEEEKKNPKQFAANVRKVMAEFLEVPTLDYSYDDCKLLKQAKIMNIPHYEDIIEIKMCRKDLGLLETNIEKELCTSNTINCKNCRVTLSDFANRLNVDADHPAVKDMFNIFDPDTTKTIDIRRYLLCAVFLMKNEEPVIRIIQILSEIYHDTDNGPGVLSLNDVDQILRHTVDMEREDIEEIFDRIDSKRRAVITIDELTEYLKNDPDYAHLFELPMTSNSNRKSAAKKSQ